VCFVPRLCVTRQVYYFLTYFRILDDEICFLHFLRCECLIKDILVTKGCFRVTQGSKKKQFSSISSCLRSKKETALNESLQFGPNWALCTHIQPKTLASCLKTSVNLMQLSRPITTRNQKRISSLQSCACPLLTTAQS
jgi:hypothetical protein